MNKRYDKSFDFDAVSVSLAAPEVILNWSYGEVTKPETINYRTGRSERGGLFDERIFGPEKDYECYCGKYKRIRYKDIVCEKCGVEVTRSIVRRERTGHIKLAAPVTHIWFLRGIPSRLALALDVPSAELERVVYFAAYIITAVDNEAKSRVIKSLEDEYKTRTKEAKDESEKEKIRDSFDDAKHQLESIVQWKVVDEVTYHRLSARYAHVFEAGIGAEAVYQIFQKMNVKEVIEGLKSELAGAGSIERLKIQRRLNLYRHLEQARARPEWMFLSVLPVIPPGLRPMVALDGGRHATSDVNDLYRRVINRNNRLRKLIDLKAPEVILRNEKRILQEAVDALIDNTSRRGGGDSAMNQAQRRPLKSLADNLRGKQGRFRQNLLGKRVDYSGRSVIVIGPELKIDQCGLPKHMALELFRPFIIAEILNQELAYNIRGAGRLIDEGIPEVWAILETVIRDKYVLLNRAPTLHRLGIQAFRPVLIEGNAIQVHPLVCTAFNADFDGDQMAVHVPLSSEAQREAREIIASSNNILKPGSGDPVVNLKLDIVLGCFWMTKAVSGELGEGKIFSDPNSAIMAYDFGFLSPRAQIKLSGGSKAKYMPLLKNGPIETTVGRILFNNMLPPDFPYLNCEINGRQISQLIEDLISRYGLLMMPAILDKIKSFGFKYATKSGITWGIDDVEVPAGKKEIIKQARTEAETIKDKYEEGLLSDTERYRMVIEVWQGAKIKVEKTLADSLPVGGSVSDMLRSNARGSLAQVSQMAGMKGLIINPAGRLIDFPIVPSFKEGLSPLEYFITTHGSRKTLADTALNTAQAGYLTRKLVDVAQEVVINVEDCGDTEGKSVDDKQLSGFDSGISVLLVGRVLAGKLCHPDGSVLFPAGHLIGKADAQKAEKAGVASAVIRSPLSCKNKKGVCRQCYGTDPGRGELVALGEAVGIVAAQAIGEPGTQLTMRTKHSGGVDTGGDIVGGLPRVTEIFERRNPKSPAFLSELDGLVLEVESKMRDKVITVVAAGRTKKEKTVEYVVPPARTVIVKKGQAVTKGEPLTDGAVNLVTLFKLAGKDATENYIISQINAIYQLQGVSIARKHIELIVRQMFSRCRITNPGDTRFALGETAPLSWFIAENERTLASGGGEAKAEMVLLGITETALTTASFLSAISFQHTTRVLIDAAVKGSVDHLAGLKENVMIGRLIPAGTGLKDDYRRAPPVVYDNYSVDRNQEGTEAKVNQ